MQPETAAFIDQVVEQNSAHYKTLKGCLGELDGFAEGRAVREVLIQLIATGDSML